MHVVTVIIFAGEAIMYMRTIVSVEMTKLL